MEIVSLRYFNVFGPRQDPTSQYAAVVPRFIHAIASGEPVTISRRRRAVARLHVRGQRRRARTCSRPTREKASGEIFNVATGQSFTVNALADAIGALLDRPVEKLYEPTREADVRASWADLGEARRVLGYAPLVDFEDGLRKDSRPRARRKGVGMGYSFGSLDELGEGYGFRKVRRALGVTAFGVNAIVYPPGYEGFHHYHDTQDELYFVHSGRALFEVEGETRELGPAGSATSSRRRPRKVTNASETEDLVMLVIGGKDGYVERDGHMVDEADIERRARFGSGDATA